MNPRSLFSFIIFGLLFLLLLLGLTTPAQSALAIPQATIPPSSVIIDGPTAGIVDISHTFTATISPPNAMLPITYTWEATGQTPVMHTSSGLTDTVSFTWPTSGTHVITVTAANDWGTATETHSLNVVHVPLDVVVAFDVSGSMRYETNCFGCWNKNPARDIIEYPYPTNGDFNPLNYMGDDVFWDGGVVGHPICGAPPSPLMYGFHYLVHEAEFYSADVPLHGWEFDKRQPGQGFWVLQRPNRGSNGSYIKPHPYPTYSQNNIDYYPQLQGAAYNSECFVPPYECWKARADALGESAPSNVPWVEYDFTPDWPGQTHIWIRAQGSGIYAREWSGRNPSVLYDWQKSIYWQVDLGSDGLDPGNPDEQVGGGVFNNLPTMDGFDYIASDDRWRWVKLGTINTGAPGIQHSLRLYQGSSGFNVDKIIFTDDPYGSPGTVVNRLPGLSPYGNEGPDATDGSATREACNKCNPAFGRIVNPTDCSCKKSPSDPGSGAGLGCTTVSTTTDQLANDLFHDIAPLRSTQETVKYFAQRLNPRFDQLGLVAFSTHVPPHPRVKLQCLRYAAAGHIGPADEAICYDPSMSPISYTNVIWAVEDHTPDGATNISEGIMEGLEELGVSVPVFNENVDSDCSNDTSPAGDGHACDRGGAAQRVIVLITEGAPSQSAPCPGSYQWRGRIGQSQDTYDCAMFYADWAAYNDVALYTIGIGPGANVELLTAMATGTDPNPVPGDDGFYFERHCGQAFFPARPDDISNAFDEILVLSRSCVSEQDTPELSITKSAPIAATSGAPITYTLTITNSGTATATDLVVTDTIPAGATYVTGGTRIGNVVSWTIPSLAANGGVTQTTFTVTATETITNSDYRVNASGGYSATGSVIVVTTVSAESPGMEKVYLPVILKE